jgi:hypothetical protein
VNVSDQGKQWWRELCERARSERNPQRPVKIVAEANKFIEEKELASTATCQSRLLVDRIG